jgi:hypothetical protein
MSLLMKKHSEMPFTTLSYDWDAEGAGAGACAREGVRIKFRAQIGLSNKIYTPYLSERKQETKTEKRTNSVFDMDDMLATLNDITYNENHIVPVVLSIINWVNNNPGYTFPKTGKSWKNEINSKFTTLTVKFPLSDLKKIKIRPTCPREFLHIKSYIKNDTYMTNSSTNSSVDDTGIVKLNVEIDELFHFLISKHILIRKGYRRMHLSKRFYDATDIESIKSGDLVNIKHRRYH